ncbi:MAG TPA: Fic family protein [Candidatus Limnocylindria bacterium]|nr:Fic family protein [Candidatus Limnocylindria bacterium]
MDESALQTQTRELDEWRARLDTRPFVRSWEGRLRRDLEAEAVAASTSMEGVPVTIEEVRRILAGERPSGVSASDVGLVRGYREAMEYIQRRADDRTFEWSPELIKAIQDRVLAGDYRKGAGRYGVGRWVVDSATGQPIFTPPGDELVPELVERVCDQMSTWNAHPAIKSAWIHVATAAIHPFKDGNGRTSRVLASLAMYRGEFRRPEFCSLEEWWGRHKGDYYASFKCLGSEWNASADVTPFVASHVAAQLSQVRALDLRERVNRQVWTALEQIAKDAGLPDRAANALWDAFNGRDVLPSFYRRLVDVSEGTGTTDLKILSSARLLQPEGRTKGRRYLAGPALFSAIAAATGVSAPEPDRSSIRVMLASRLVGGSSVEPGSALHAPSPPATVAIGVMNAGEAGESQSNESPPRTKTSS